MQFESKQVGKTITKYLIFLVPLSAALLTAYIMSSSDIWGFLYNIEQNAMLRGFLIEFIIRPIMAGIIGVAMFCIGYMLLKRLGIQIGCLALLKVVFLSLVFNAVIAAIQTPLLTEWLFMILLEWFK